MPVAPEEDFPRAVLVPELLVASLGASLRFWRDLCGFRVAYARPDEGFAYLDRGGAQVMLEERGRGRNWITGPLEAPLGRGLNLEIMVPTLAPVLEALEHEGWPLFVPPEEKWYRAGEAELGVRQFLVQDPDGYLLRFSAPLGRRPWAGPEA
ncbi:bleomycin resistance protein [Teichococcus aestuarii]|uniref:Bleomycin resistance protein n=1 Tax=Teichococcus aestuarii TaxID=568898 RepID=A0A2U1V9V6_9PROT|nr:VOC family protein [Pseudoroseomonas aestuarii]PWC30711.1 bleomycin resistance family protein [Pseudoroseomonas aestuarii]